jgi:hypothetical protein
MTYIFLLPTKTFFKLFLFWNSQLLQLKLPILAGFTLLLSWKRKNINWLIADGITKNIAKFFFSSPISSSSTRSHLVRRQQQQPPRPLIEFYSGTREWKCIRRAWLAGREGTQIPKRKLQTAGSKRKAEEGKGNGVWSKRVQQREEEKMAWKTRLKESILRSFGFDKWVEKEDGMRKMALTGERQDGWLDNMQYIYI